MRTTLPRMLCLIGGVIMLIQFFVPWEPIQKTFLDWVSNSSIIVGVFGLAIGLASLVHFHGLKIVRQRPGWGFSLVTFVAAGVITILGLVPAKAGPKLAKHTTVALLSAGVTNVHTVEHTLFGNEPIVTVTNVAGVIVQQRTVPLYDWCYKYVFNALMTTTFSLLAFYMMTAAYRAMRAKTWEAGLLLAAALVVLLGQVPVDQFIPVGTIEHLSTFEWLKKRLLDYPNMAAMRSVTIGVALGGLATSVKILAGVEKPYLGG